MTQAQAEAQKNPRRVVAGRQNRRQRGPLSEAGRQRLRLAALRHQPWQFATGPRTAAGKRQAAWNGKRRQLGPRSVREAKADLAEVRALIGALRAARRQLG